MATKITPVSIPTAYPDSPDVTAWTGDKWVWCSPIPDTMQVNTMPTRNDDEFANGSPSDVVGRNQWVAAKHTDGERVDEQATKDAWTEKYGKLYEYTVAVRWDAREVFLGILGMTHGAPPPTPTQDATGPDGYTWWIEHLESTMVQAAKWGPNGLERLDQAAGLGKSEDGPPVFLFAQKVNPSLSEYSGLQKESRLPTQVEKRWEKGEVFQTLPGAAGDPTAQGAAQYHGKAPSLDDLKQAWNLQ